MKSRVSGTCVRRGAITAAMLGCVAFSVNTAHADTSIALPGGDVRQTLGDGNVVTLTLSGESATITPSLAASPLHRHAWASGHVAVDISGPNMPIGLRIYPGYLVGCQVDIGTFASDTGNSQVSPPPSGSVPPITIAGTLVPPATITADPSTSTGGPESFAIRPGQAVARYILDIKASDDHGNESRRAYHQINGSRGSLTWNDETIAVNGCGGPAQARSFVAAQVLSENDSSMVLLWGQPFSLG